MEDNKRNIGILLLLTVYTVLVRAGENNRQYDNCGAYEDCYSCTSRDCKWCLLDKKCYSETLLPTTSQCEPEQVVTTSQNCGNRLYKAYSAAFAYENSFLVAAANTNKSQECLQKMFPHMDYKVIATISTRCDDFFFKYPSCYAYVGLTHSKKTIVIAYRGTKDVKQFFEEALVSLSFPKIKFEAGGQVEAYFYNAHIKLYDMIKSNVTLLQSKYPDYEILFIGHSLGGAMASLASASFIHENITQSSRLTLYTFGMPRVGNRDYARAHDKLVPNSYRLVHHEDIIPHLPVCGSLCAANSGNKANVPFHHGKEVFYPNSEMNETSHFILCRGDEDDRCSDGSILKQCFFHILSCFRDHRYYFGTFISKYCDRIMS